MPLAAASPSAASLHGRERPVFSDARVRYAYARFSARRIVWSLRLADYLVARDRFMRG
jgi:hypothetical protein